MTKKLFYLTILFFLAACTSKTKYITNNGFIFGTTYHIVYQSNTNYADSIKTTLLNFNKSLSTYDPGSVISRINKNDTSVIPDKYFIDCFNTAILVSENTNGAFDITVAPLVNAWGFGFNDSIKADSAKIKSLMPCIGYTKVKLLNNKIIKNNPCIMLDASAIAKGQGVDIVAGLLESLRVKNYMVEIGGEVRAKGINPKGNIWRIGIDKPVETNDMTYHDINEVIALSGKSLATSGNYRQFYEKDGIKYSHTIDPLTGFPARHSLLSASVLANTCITADAYATAFMVMGVDKSIALALSNKNIDIYLIYSDSLGQYKTYATPGFIDAIEKAK